MDGKKDYDPSSSDKTAVTGLTSVATIVAGANHSGAIRTDGSLRLWGLGTNGQIGDTFTTNRWTATAPAAPSTGVHLALGSTFSLATSPRTVTYTARDAANNQQTCSFTVTVIGDQTRKTVV